LSLDSILYPKKLFYYSIYLRAVILLGNKKIIFFYHKINISVNCTQISGKGVLFRGELMELNFSLPANYVLNQKSGNASGLHFYMKEGEFSFF